jgi:hypothetical protein
MERTRRSYTKQPPNRNASIILIIAEGKREDGYFKRLREQISNIKIEIIHREDGVSSPKYAFQRLEEYKAISKWNQLDGDQVWFVFDTDDWRGQIDALISECQNRENHFTAFSNPCFEVWLHYHSRREMPEMTAQELKEQLAEQPIGQYSANRFIPHIQVAIVNAQAADTHPERAFPSPMQTKVYKLAESLLAVMRK